MTGPVRLLLALLPLAGYFFVLGAWHSRREAKAVSGPIDAGLLAFPLGSLIAFGPVGGFLVDRLFPRPSLAAWLAVASFVGLVGLYTVAQARRRIVVYHVEPDDLTLSLGQAMERLAGPVSRTIRGFENLEDGRGLTIEFGRWLGYAVVETHGDRAESLADALVPALAARLKDHPRSTTRLSTLWFGLACATTLLLAASVAILTRSTR